MSVFGSSSLPFDFLYGVGTLLPASVPERITRRSESTKKLTKGNNTTCDHHKHRHSELLIIMPNRRRLGYASPFLESHFSCLALSLGQHQPTRPPPHHSCPVLTNFLLFFMYILCTHTSLYMPISPSLFQVDTVLLVFIPPLLLVEKSIAFNHSVFLLSFGLRRP